MRPPFAHSIALVIAVCLAVVACNCSSHSAMQPFQIPTWATYPTDDEIVNAIVGTGGSAEARMLAEGAVRELVLPDLVSTRELDLLRARLENLRIYYTSEAELDPAARLVRVCVKSELERLTFRSMALSQVRLRSALWPTEPFPERWSPGAELPPMSGADIVNAAASIGKRLDEVTGRYGIVGPSEERSAALIRNSVKVATTGDHSVTYGPVFEVLNQRGMGSRPLPAATPY